MTVSQKPIKVSQISPVCFTGMKPDQHWLWQPNCYTYNYFYINSCLHIPKHIVFAVWILSSNVFGLFPKLMYKKVNGGADSLLPRRSEHTSAHRAIKLLTGSFSTLCSRLWSTLSQPAAGPEAWRPPPTPPAQSVTAPTLLLIPRMCDSEWNNLKSS